MAFLKKLSSIFYLVGFLLSSVSTSSATLYEIQSAAVKIFTVYSAPSYQMPWQMKGKVQFSGSGCIINGNKIITNAHVVKDQLFIEVRRAGQSKKYPAKVQAISHAADLAVLEVADPHFFEGAKPLELGELPLLQDQIAVYGFPEGGDKLSVTEGIVSRVEHVHYAHSNAFLLACQIDASINSGNSGGPVIRDGKLVGVAFQGLASQNFENIGYMVPTPVIRHFLQDIEDGTNHGFPTLGLSLQKMENPSLQKYYKMKEGQTGVLTNKVYPDSSASGFIKAGDIITAINNKEIANDGTIQFRKGERTFFGYAVQNSQIGDSVNLEIIRSGNTIVIKVPLSGNLETDRLVPNMKFDEKPRYFIFGGFVFQPLTLNYLKEFGNVNDWYLFAPTELLHLYQNGEPSKNRKEVVILSQVLADHSNSGYHEFSNNVITAVNGKQIQEFADLVNAFKHPSQSGYHLIEDSKGFRIVLKESAVKENHAKILKKYAISGDKNIAK